MGTMNRFGLFFLIRGSSLVTPTNSLDNIILVPFFKFPFFNTMVPSVAWSPCVVFLLFYFLPLFYMGMMTESFLVPNNNNNNNYK